MNKQLGELCGVLASIAIVGFGCGGNDLRCGEVAPCGGDVVGSWELKDACFDVAALEAESREACPGFRLLRLDLLISGTVTFTATAYTSSATSMVTFEETIPADCPLVGGMTCAELGATLEATGGGQCSGDTVCTCSGTTSGQVFGASGTYTISGTTLSLTETGTGLVESGDYCVSDGAIHFPSVGPMGMMGEMPILADIVGERR